ncbi:hypothetical protein FOA52_015868 [Chlamydomonas sp. UWO 241]|nr:hypothetical protein FOA52_015868 [Chlamydomonas sp. UWO 241]
MVLVYVKKHTLGRVKIEAVVTTTLNTVEELEFACGLEDAAWLNSDGKWVVIHNREKMKVADMPLTLFGDGKSSATAFEVNQRVGGVFYDAAAGAVWAVKSAFSWATARRGGYASAKSEDDNA